MGGPDLCRCLRCHRVVERRGGPLWARALFVGAWVFVLPWAATLAVTGAGVFVFAPIVAALGCSIIAAFRDAAFPEPDCGACGAALDHAPRVADPALRATRANVPGVVPSQRMNAL